MPKQQHNFIYYNISNYDFDTKFNRLKTVSEKFDFLTNYILSFSMDRSINQDELYITDLIANARIKFIEASINAKEEYEKKNNVKLSKYVIDPQDKDHTQLDLQRKFIADPLKYIDDMAVLNRDNLVIPKNDPNREELEEWKMNLNKNIIMVRTFGDFDNFGNEFAIKDFSKRVGNSIYNNPFMDTNDLLNRNKGGFFERFFKTTSNEYQVFEATFKVFNDKNSPAYGDFDNLEGATRAYLYHKIPNFKPGDKLPKEEDIRRLSGTSKSRVEMCVGILKTIELERKMTEALEIANDENKDFDVISELDDSINEDIKLQDIGNDIGELNDSMLINLDNSDGIENNN